jgi:predicted DNA-binding transcriptional regulator AlpA
MAEKQSPDTLKAERRLRAKDVKELCGGVSDMWIYRRQKEPALFGDFPMPFYIGRRRFWREADIVAWLNAQSRRYA